MTDRTVTIDEQIATLEHARAAIRQFGHYVDLSDDHHGARYVFDVARRISTVIELVEATRP